MTKLQYHPSLLVHERRRRQALTGGCALLALIGTVLCGYGHAALNSDLYISGQAKVGGIVPFSADSLQGLTADECKAVDVGMEKQLIDLRDGKKYWVGKMADNNCWMTQNLDFDIPAVVNTDGITTDVPIENYTTNTIRLASSANWASDPSWDYNAYVDPGDFYYRGPDDQHSPGSACTVSGNNFTSCQWIAETGDAHYHIGNYYTSAAVSLKSSNGLSMNQNSEYSICPAGWQLPESGSESSYTTPFNHNKTYSKLFESYGWQWNKGYGADNLSGGTAYYVYGPPFYFTFGGITGSSRKFSYVGNRLYYSSRTQRSGTHVFMFYAFGHNLLVSPIGTAGRADGLSVRCVLK